MSKAITGAGRDARPARDREPLDFQAECDQATTSWQRATPDAASIERYGRHGFLVELPDGDPHFCGVGQRPGDGAFVGFCKCRGFEYNDGPCAHLCTLRKADWHADHLEGAIYDDRQDEPVSILPVVELDESRPDAEHAAAQRRGETGAHGLDPDELDRLSDRQRDVWSLVVDDGLSPCQAADQLDIQDTTARTHLYRARGKLGARGAIDAR